MDPLTTVRSVLPARSKAIEQLETAGCRTLGDLQHLITRCALTLSPGDDLRIDWLIPVDGLRMSRSAWQTLLWALERGLGAPWTPEAAKAWTNAYTTLSNFMVSEAYGRASVAAAG